MLGRFLRPCRGLSRTAIRPTALAFRSVVWTTVRETPARPAISAFESRQPLLRLTSKAMIARAASSPVVNGPAIEDGTAPELASARLRSMERCRSGDRGAGLVLRINSDGAGDRVGGLFTFAAWVIRSASSMEISPFTAACQIERTISSASIDRLDVASLAASTPRRSALLTMFAAATHQTFFDPPR